jgi:cysteine desulfurase
MENVPALVGMGAAAAELAARRAPEAAEQRRLSQRVLDWATAADGVRVLGDPVDRLAHLVCLGIDGVEPQPVLLGLDQAGVAVHSGSSCSSEALEPSPVLAAMGADADRSLRVSAGWNSTDADIDRLIQALPTVLDRLRRLGG